MQMSFTLNDVKNLFPVIYLPSPESFSSSVPLLLPTPLKDHWVLKEKWVYLLLLLYRPTAYWLMTFFFFFFYLSADCLSLQFSFQPFQSLPEWKGHPVWQWLGQPRGYGLGLLGLSHLHLSPHIESCRVERDFQNLLSQLLRKYSGECLCYLQNRSGSVSWVRIDWTRPLSALGR